MISLFWLTVLEAPGYGKLALLLWVFEESVYEGEECGVCFQRYSKERKGAGIPISLSGGMNKDGSHGLICGNAWSPVGGSDWKGFRIVVLLSSDCGL